MTRTTLIAVATLGQKNMTRVTAAHDLSDANLDRLAQVVAKKNPNKTYYVVEVTGRTWAKKAGSDPLYVWHVGEGFTHAQGWWVHYED